MSGGPGPTTVAEALTTSLLGVSGAPTSPLLALAGMDADRRADRGGDARGGASRTDPYLTEIASHLIVAGGKRLRPALAVVAAAVGGQPVSDDVVRGGVACELVHLGSLYHDDVMDEAEMRRGVETVNASWGNLQAILAGDFLLARASEIAASLGTEVAGLLARTIGWLCEGQIEELRHTYDTARSEDSYLASIHGKTASLFGTAARIGGIVAGLDRPTIDAMTEYGNAYGMVFQIVDDVLDLTATGRATRQAGRATTWKRASTRCPSPRTLSNGRSSGDELRDMLGKPLEPAERDKALAIVRSDEGIESAIATGESYAGRARRRSTVSATARSSRRCGRPRRRSCRTPSPPSRRCSVRRSTRPVDLRVGCHGADRDADAVGELGRARVPAPQRVGADADQRAGERRPRRGRAGDASRQRRATQHTIDQPADLEVRAVALVDQLRVALQRRCLSRSAAPRRARPLRARRSRPRTRCPRPRTGWRRRPRRRPRDRSGPAAGRTDAPIGIRPPAGGCTGSGASRQRAQLSATNRSSRRAGLTTWNDGEVDIIRTPTLAVPSPRGNIHP